MIREPKERSALQDALFKCSECNKNQRNGCKIRNEDLLGSYKAPIWLVGINPHCTYEEIDSFQNKILKATQLGSRKLTSKFWKYRSEHYFDENDDTKMPVTITGEYYNENKTPYRYYTSIEKRFKTIKFGKNCSHTDFYKIGTVDEQKLENLIKENEFIKECPKLYFLKQIEIAKPNLLIFSGNRTKNWLKARFKEQFDYEDALPNLFEEGISKIKLEVIKWKPNNKEYSVLFCPSFSTLASRYWREKEEAKLCFQNLKKVRFFNNIIEKFHQKY